MLSAVGHAIIIAENVIGFIILALAIGFLALITNFRSLSYVDSFAPFVLLIGHCILLCFSVGASLSLREQIKNGEYRTMWAPGPPHPSNAVQMYAPQDASSPAEAITQEARTEPNDS